MQKINNKKLLSWGRGVNSYGLRVSLTDFCDLHRLTGVRCNLYGYLWFLQIQSYNHSTLYIRTVISLQWHQICFVNTKVNDMSHNKLCFVCLLYMGVLQRDPIPKLCFAMVLTICNDFFADCKDFLSWSYRYEMSQVDTSVLRKYPPPQCEHCQYVLTVATFWWSAIILLEKGNIYLVEEMWWNHLDSIPH